MLFLPLSSFGFSLNSLFRMRKEFLISPLHTILGIPGVREEEKF
jgi:hypothetical protein